MRSRPAKGDALEWLSEPSSCQKSTGIVEVEVDRPGNNLILNPRVRHESRLFPGTPLLARLYENA